MSQNLNYFFPTSIQRFAVLIFAIGLFFYVFLPEKISEIFDFRIIFGFGYNRKALFYDQVWQILVQSMIWGGLLIAFFGGRLKRFKNWLFNSEVTDNQIDLIRAQIQIHIDDFSKIAKNYDEGLIGQGEYDQKKMAHESHIALLLEKIKRL